MLLPRPGPLRSIQDSDVSKTPVLLSPRHWSCRPVRLGLQKAELPETHRKECNNSSNKSRQRRSWAYALGNGKTCPDRRQEELSLRHHNHTTQNFSPKPQATCHRFSLSARASVVLGIGATKGGWDKAAALTSHTEGLTLSIIVF